LPKTRHAAGDTLFNRNLAEPILMKKILITGATGDTGGYAIDALLAQGQTNVRAFVRSDDARAQDLRARGVEIAVGDLLDLNAVRAALEEVAAAYFVFPIAPGGIQATAYFAQTAREAGVEAIVNMSQISARREALSHAALDHWTAERVFDWSGIAATHLRPTFFAEWLTYPFQLTSIKQGVLRSPFDKGRHAPIAAEDQGRVIAAILRDPSPHAGKVYPLFGPVELTQHEVAAALSKTLGREIRYEPMSLAAFRDEVERLLHRPYLSQHLYEVAKDHANGIFAGTNDIVRSLTNRQGTTVEEFVGANRAQFAAD
jgi:NAD(P)H dehydrogenase (quinone)